MDVVAWSQNLTAERAAEHGTTLVSKTELLATSHVISLHLVLSERSRHTIGEAEFSSMKDNAVLINTSRAGLIDELALIAALRSKPRMMAGLDVFNQEPLPASSALMQLPNAVLAPHLGYVTEPVFERFFTGFETACRAYLTNDLPSLGEHLL
jgi:phosphoglycerate dehydrogenase-like enzyme